MVQAMDGASETLITIEERVKITTEKLEADFSKVESKIHRFPASLRWVAKDDRYVVPSVVSLGPYHHGSTHLREMEEVKHVAAHYFCAESDHSVEEVYAKVLSVAGEARSCYADDAVADISDANFAAMMFLDGCFLLQYVGLSTNPLLQNRMTLSTGPCMLRDIFLLENQLPWLVLEALMTFRYVSVVQFLAGMASFFNVSPCSTIEFFVNESYRPPHLLGLLRYYLIGGMPPEELSYKGTFFSLASSAIELAEIGVKLTASNEKWFADMSLDKRKAQPFGELSLTPLFLNDFTACWLVNMAAFEACTSTSLPSDGYTICSYLSLLAMLMDKEEDVHELRAKHLVHSFFSDQEMLEFFKGLARHLRLGTRYFVISEKIEEYKRERRLWIVMHKFQYNYLKTIVAVCSAVGVVVGLFKAIMDLKAHRK